MLLTSGIVAFLGIVLVQAQGSLAQDAPSKLKVSATTDEYLPPVLRTPFSKTEKKPTHPTSNIIPGAYLVEFADGHDNASFFTNLHANGLHPIPRMDLNFTLFKGASFRINDEVVQEHIQVSRISAMAAVKQMWPLRNYSVPNTQRKNLMHNPNAAITRIDDMLSMDADSLADAKKRKKDALSTHVMTQVDKLHAEGKTGEGIRIGIVDTGVDYTHPALGGCFGNKKNCVVKYGYDLVGDYWDGFSAPDPDDDPFDNCEGHGTHVAGIIAAQQNEMNFTGVAPGATLGMYKVFSCVSWGTSDDVLIASFNMAFEDGSDIITASIGGIEGWNEVPWSVAVSRIVAEGVPCTLAAGNSGYYGLFTASDAANGIGVTSVASFDNVVTPSLLPKAFYRTSAMEPQTADTDAHKGTAFGWQPSFPSFKNVSLPLLALSNNSNVIADACKTLPEDTPDLSQYAVLVRLGGCNAQVKVEHIVAKNAANIIFYATDNLDLPEYELYDPFSQSPLNGSGTVTAALGARWVELLNNGEQVQVIFTEPATADVVFMEVENTITGGFASSYTSWGPTWELAVYPSIGAPGGNILSTYLTNMGSYAVMSGTSMATPFAAGVLALINQVQNASLAPAQLDSLVASTAKANFWNDGGGALRDLAPVSQQGPGLIQAYDAAYTTTLVSKASIAFNDSDHSPGAVEFTLSNESDDTVTYELTNVPALGMYMLSLNHMGYRSSYDSAYFPNPIFAATASLNFSNTTVRLAPRARALLRVEAAPPSNDEGALTAAALPVYSGFIAINGSSDSGGGGSGVNLTIPYMGLAGSLYSAANLDLLASTNLGCSELAYEVSQPQADYCLYHNASFTLPYPTGQLDDFDLLTSYGEYPTVLFRLALASALVRIDVLPLSRNFSGPTKQVLGETTAGSIYGWPMKYLDRVEFEVGFNGMLADGSVVPEGRYGLLVRVLKLFGDPERARDYSSVIMVPFSLHYDNSTAWSGFPPAHKGLRWLN